MFADAMQSNDPNMVEEAIRYFQEYASTISPTHLGEEMYAKLPYKDATAEKNNSKMITARELLRECTQRLLQKLIQLYVVKNDLAHLKEIPQMVRSLEETGKKSQIDIFFLKKEVQNEWLNALFRLAMQEKNPKKVAEIYQFLKELFDRHEQDFFVLQRIDAVSLDRTTSPALEFIRQQQAKERKEAVVRNEESFFNRQHFRRPSPSRFDEVMNKALGRSNVETFGNSDTEAESEISPNDEWIERIRKIYLEPIQKKLGISK